MSGDTGARNGEPPPSSRSGAVELLADADRPGGWLLLTDRIRQSYVDLEDPSYLDFEYMRSFADVLEALPGGPLAVTHIGGGAGTLVRYVAATRPGSTQIVLEPDAELTALVRARLPFGRDVRVRIRPVDGRGGLAALRDAGADLVVLDAFAGGRVPAELATTQFVSEVARVLKPSGVLMANVADGAGLAYTKRVVATLSTGFGQVLLRADPQLIKGRRFGNVVLAAARAGLPVAEITRSAAAAMFPQRVLAGAELDAFAGQTAPFTDGDAQRSPAPPDELWRVGE